MGTEVKQYTTPNVSDAQVREIAAEYFGGETSCYESDDQQVFALLVAVTRAYVEMTGEGTSYKARRNDFRTAQEAVLENLELEWEEEVTEVRYASHGAIMFRTFEPEA